MIGATEEILEIETVITLKGPLAERLIKLAAVVGKTPVDIVADIVEFGLGEQGHKFSDAAVQIAPPTRRRWRADADHRVAALQRENDDLRAKLDTATRTRNERALTFANDIEQFLKSEAKSRNMAVEALLRAIVEAVVEDRLFAAVLDQ